MTGPSPLAMLREFHEAFNCRIDEPWTPELMGERQRLIDEEYREAREAMIDGRDLGAIAKELADLAYVVYGAAVNLGIDLDEALRIVHASNMAKLGPDGRPIYDNGGKVLKPPGYTPPDMTPALPTAPTGEQT